MPDREKVVRAIEEGVASARDPLGINVVQMTVEFCEECLLPLLRERKRFLLTEDGKLQPIDDQARLVTREDFLGSLADDGGAIPCWKESRKPTHRSGWASIVYGKMLNDAGTARYWTKRPTAEQMKEVPWNG